MSKKLNKTINDMTLLEQRFLEIWVGGKNLGEAFIETHPGTTKKYAPQRGWELKEKLKERDGFKRIMAAAGIGEEFLANKIKQLLGAKRTQYFQYEGRVTDERECEDNAAQLGALKIATEVSGLQKQRIDLEVSGGKSFFADMVKESESKDEETHK